MTEAKQGFLFNVVHDTGNGTQIQAAFNLPEGAKKADMDSVLDELYGSLKRLDARIRFATIEQQYMQQVALVTGTKVAVERLHDSPANAATGKRQSAVEGQYQSALAQLDADTAKMELFKRSLVETAKEAEIEVPECIRQAS
jgi:hypothetical protein